ncbi:hypothetical protein ACWIG5_05425 [Streptomyces lydicus]
MADFDGVRQRVTRAEAHVLPGQGHLAHIHAPTALGHLLNGLAAVR